MFDNFLGFVESPVAAILLCLLLGAIAVSGKFSQVAANVLLLAMWIVGSLSIVRMKSDPRLLSAGVLFLAAFCCFISYWIQPPKSEAAQGTNSVKAPQQSSDAKASPPSVPCSTPFRPGSFSSGNIVENGQTANESSAQSKITSANDTARNGGAMFDVKHVGTADFDHSTTVGNAEILKSDKVDKLKATNSLALPSLQPSMAHAFNVGDWFDFLEDYEQSVVDKNAARAIDQIKHLRERLTLEWGWLPEPQRKANQKELETVLAAIKGVPFNPHYRDWPPTFVDRPCDVEPPSQP